MKDPLEQQIKAEMEEISKNIDTILHRIQNLDPGAIENLPQNDE